MDQSMEENKVIIDGLTRYGGLNQPNLKFIKVNVDCWEKIFDFLSFRDILAMSQTCQRMRQIGGYYYRENFHGTECGLHKFLGPQCRLNKTAIPIENCEFLRFIDTVSVIGLMEHLEYYSDLLPAITSLRLLMHLNVNDFHGVKNVLNGIECVEFDESYFDGHVASQFLALCPKLKRLQFKFIELEANALTQSDLFKRNYPALEYFEYTDCDEMASLMLFLELNSNIKYLRISAIDLYKIEYNKATTIQLDCLSIKVDLALNDRIEFVNRLKKLHANDFYKKLHLLFDANRLIRDKDLDDLDNLNLEVFINELISFEALEIVYAYQFHRKISQLIELKELYLRNLSDEVDSKPLAMNLTKLNRLWIGAGSIDHLLPFLCHSKTLKMAIMHTAKDDDDSDTEYSGNALDLFTLNKMRQLNGMSSKVLIGVFENTYLATKWKWGSKNYDLIEFIRAEKIFKHFQYKNMHFEYY